MKATNGSALSKRSIRSKRRSSKIAFSSALAHTTLASAGEPRLGGPLGGPPIDAHSGNLFADAPLEYSVMIASPDGAHRPMSGRLPRRTRRTRVFRCKFYEGLSIGCHLRLKSLSAESHSSLFNTIHRNLTCSRIQLAVI